MLKVFIQNATPPRGHGVTSMLRHLGAFGLFSLAIVDSSPLPTFGGPDILTAILAATHRNPWYEYAAGATAGSVIGAYLTFRIARRAGSAYLHSKFGHHKLDAVLRFFQKWGTSALAVSTAVPIPMPTSMLFAAAGASDYGVGRFLTVVIICRSRLECNPLVRFCLDHLSQAEMLAHQQDLDLATQIQSKLLPLRDIALESWDARYRYLPVGAVGGDYCDLIVLGDGKSIFFAVGDVAGKGVAASLLMTHLSAIFRSLLSLDLPLAEQIGRANRLFCEGTAPSHYATLGGGRERCSRRTAG